MTRQRACQPVHTVQPASHEEGAIVLTVKLPVLLGNHTVFSNFHL
ncbi:hypothetical protein [Corallococcus macrosporus]|nr:hypothetical protein [Corallococcus macrosporus]